ncbi:MAG: hypothetical protein FGM15_07630 [Chthoniobacterales bacterium]|nr:hypothetical protein [Chthoniobacterales bacterium]
MTKLQMIWACPKLPSGRWVALDCWRLREAVNEADRTGDVTELLEIWREHNVRRHIEVVEIVERPDLPPSELAMAEINDQQRVPVMTMETGYTMDDVLSDKAPWSPEDTAVFREFTREIWVHARVALCLMRLRDCLAMILARTPEEQACR